MSIKNAAIHIAFEATTLGILSELAQHEHKSVEGIAKELIIEALERREDRTLSAIAESRDKPGVARVKHEDAWK